MLRRDLDFSLGSVKDDFTEVHGRDPDDFPIIRQINF